MRHRRIFRQQNGKCFYCGIKMVPPKMTGPNDSRIRTVDHLIPKFLDGLSIPSNLVYACKGCNEAKGHQMPEKFIMKFA